MQKYSEMGALDVYYDHMDVEKICFSGNTYAGYSDGIGEVQNAWLKTFIKS